MIGWTLDPHPSGLRFTGPRCIRCGIAAPAWAVTAARNQADLGQLTCGICVEAKTLIAKRSDEPEPSFNRLTTGSEER